MATQQIEFEAPSGMTLTCTLHVAGSDTIAKTASAVVEQTNRKGVYRATFSSVSANTYQLIARSGSTGVAAWWGYAQDIAATFSFGTNVTKTDGYVNSFISEQIASDIENDSNNWDIASAVLGARSATSVWESVTSSHTTNNTFGQRVLRSTTSHSTVAVTGSNHVAADIHEIQAGAIVDSDFAAGSIYAKLGTLIEADPVSGFRYTTQALEQAPASSGLDAAGVRSAIGLAAANLDTQLSAIDDYIDTEVAAIKTVTDKLNTTVEIDGAVYRFTTNALEQAPSGVGGGSGGQTVVISPSAALQNQYYKTTDRNPNPLDCPLYAQKTFSISFYSLDNAGEKVPVDMESKTLRVTFESSSGADLAVLENAAIAKSGNSITFTNPAAASTPPNSAKKMMGKWSCRETSNNFVWGYGTWEVFDVAFKDP
jgi:hypothetical protein